MRRRANVIPYIWEMNCRSLLCGCNVDIYLLIEFEELQMAMTAADVLKMAKDNEVKFVDFRFADTRGKEQIRHRTDFSIQYGQV